MKKRLFSGMQPSGSLHIGNYMGALRNWIERSTEYDCIYCIVDYHAITIPYDPEEMRSRIYEAALDYLAGGLDPAQCKIFVQSHIPQHTELAWVFNSVTPLGQLMRMTQFKQKTMQFSDATDEEEQQSLGEEFGEDRDSFLSRAGRINAGLLTYPVLQAADILLYKGEVVPVGEDQVQHVELSRDVARRFNNRFQPIFPLCQSLLSSAPRIMGLDAVHKMSKSLGNHIPLSMPAEEVTHKITRESVSDPRRVRRSDPGVPEECNLYAWHQIFSSPEEQEWAHEGCRTAGIGCFQCKKVVAANINALLDPIRERRQQLLNRPDDVWDVLRTGANQCRPLAEETMKEVHQTLGIR